MYVITYSLKAESGSSDQYYRDIAAFTDEVLDQALHMVGKLTEDYSSYDKSGKINRVNSHDEYTLELLTMGVLWQVYSGDALGLDDVPAGLLSGLSKLRKQGGNLKPGIDFLRGILSTIFLSPDLYDNLFTLEPSLEHFCKLIKWLDATGEFSHELKKLNRWYNFLSQLPEERVADELASILTLSAWFSLRSQEVLGCYTENVDCFLNETRPRHYWQEDVIFCGRRRVEYHLNMVGAEILNRVYRQAFISSDKKLIVLPACMRLLPANRCRAVDREGVFRCAGCMKECMVNRLTQLGAEHGVDVAVIPHESSIASGGAGQTVIETDTGVVGVACVLNLISGGWMLEEMGLAAQCVILDYCGCKNHWHDEGFPTELNIQQLLKVISG